MFTTGDWNTPQAITLTGLDDAVGDGDIALQLTTTASSTDTSFDGASTFAQAIVNRDNELYVSTIDDVIDGDTSSVDALLADRGADGEISLREAITAANANANLTVIGFALPGPGPQTISLASLLPTITAPITLDGTTDDAYSAVGDQRAVVLDGNDLSGDGITLSATADGSTILGLVIRNFGGNGVTIASGSDNNRLEGNYIGQLNPDGGVATAGLGNTGIGLYIQGSNAYVGGNTDAARNVIAGNTINISIENGNGAEVYGNYLGTDASGMVGAGGLFGVRVLASDDNTLGSASAGLGNLISGHTGSGVYIQNNSDNNEVHGNQIGLDAAGNPTLGNGGDGISVAGTTIGNSFLQNEIAANAGLGIDLDDNSVTPNDADDSDPGPNDLQNFPVLASAATSGGDTIITGTLTSTASTDFRIEFFRNPAGTVDPTNHGEGVEYIGFVNVTTDGSGSASFAPVLLGVELAVGDSVTATATVDLGSFNYGATSEFSANVAAANSLVVATDDAATTFENTPYTFDPRVNDTDLENDTVTIIDVGQGGSGTVVNNGDGTVTYTPNASFIGADAFDYVAIDTGAGLQHYWGLDGNAVDSVGSANGTVNGTTTVAADVGSGLSFNESPTDYVELPDLSYNSEFTLSFDFKVDEINGTLVSVPVQSRLCWDSQQYQRVYR